MSGFAYFTDGEKWVENLTMNDIRALAMTGVITEATLIRNPDGQEKEAKFLGLFFSDKQPQTANLRGVRGDGELQPEEKSIMAPAITIIEIMYRLAIIGAVISGLAAVGVPEASLTGFGTSISLLFTALSLVVFKYVVLCFDSMERTFRKIEKNTRKKE
jgi:hypothetical protein